MRKKRRVSFESGSKRLLIALLVVAAAISVYTMAQGAVVSHDISEIVGEINADRLQGLSSSDIISAALEGPIDADTLEGQTASDLLASGSFSVSSCSGSPSMQPVDNPVSWTLSFNGGVPPITFSWNLDDGITSTSQYPAVTYSSGGVKQASVTVTDGVGRTQTVNCAQLKVGGHWIFATSSVYRGDFARNLPTPTPRQKATGECQLRAQSAGLPDPLLWTAWLGQGSEDLGSSHTIGTVTLTEKIFNMNGELVANSEADLMDGTIANPVRYDEKGKAIISNTRVWTASTDAGLSNFGCDDPPGITKDKHFISIDTSSYGTYGDVTKTDSEWTYMTANIICDQSYRFYCIKDP